MDGFELIGKPQDLRQSPPGAPPLLGSVVCAHTHARTYGGRFVDMAVASVSRDTLCGLGV